MVSVIKVCLNVIHLINVINNDKLNFLLNLFE